MCGPHDGSTTMRLETKYLRLSTPVTWFHPTLNLRRDTTSDQLLQVLSSFREILAGHSQVETGKMPVRFIGVGPYSLDVEVIAYVTTSDHDEFVAMQEELLLKMFAGSGTCRDGAGCAAAGELRIAKGTPGIERRPPVDGGCDLCVGCHCVSRKSQTI